MTIVVSTEYIWRGGRGSMLIIGWGRVEDVRMGSGTSNMGMKIEELDF